MNKKEQVVSGYIAKQEEFLQKYPHLNLKKESAPPRTVQLYLTTPRAAPQQAPVRPPQPAQQSRPSQEPQPTLYSRAKSFFGKVFGYR